MFPIARLRAPIANLSVYVNILYSLRSANMGLRPSLARVNTMVTYQGVSLRVEGAAILISRRDIP